jgi:hypothetical protein
MTSYLFSAWISHFLESVNRPGGIFPERRHLLILDGHNSHVTLEVVLEAKRVGLDLLTLPSHTSHALQPLEVSVFKPFKQHFREYRDFLDLMEFKPTSYKAGSCKWVALSLRKVVSMSNIQNGFSSIGIFLFNRHVVHKFFTTTATYQGVGSEGSGGEGSFPTPQ